MLVQKLDKENADLRKKLLEGETRIKKLDADLDHEKQSAAKRPSAAAKEQIIRLRQHLQEKDDELQVICQPLRPV